MFWVLNSSKLLQGEKCLEFSEKNNKAKGVRDKAEGVWCCALHDFFVTSALRQAPFDKLRAFFAVQKMGPVGLEPTTLALSTRCSNQLSYGPEEKFSICDLRLSIEGVVGFLQSQIKNRKSKINKLALPSRSSRTT